MIRIMSYRVTTRSFAIVLFTLSLVLAALPVVTRAGDQDGLGGYSMQLKRKYFDANDVGTGGNGQVVYSDPKINGSQYVPQASMSVRNGRLLIIFQHYYELFSLWVR
jgi:hypothetical protein